MNRTILLLLISVFVFLSETRAQTTIEMKQEGGVYTMPCEVNGLRLRFIFDTGASDISISLTEAIFMLKNGYLSEDDITGTTQYSIANGDIEEGTTLNLREVKIGNLKLHNVEASILHSLEAPLLLGQSALKKFGKIEFDYSNNTLTINNGDTTEFYLNNEESKVIAEIPQKLNYYTFKQLPKQEQYLIMKNSKLGMQEYMKFKKLKTAGITTMAVGTVGLITGIVLNEKSFNNYIQNGVPESDTGFYTMIISGGVMGTGAAIWALAPKKMKNAVYYYNKDHNFSLNVSPTLNGMGLTLNF